jgi:DNA-binding transcriptional ArsR family regulator
VAALCAEDAGQVADVELAGVAAGRRADPQPVAAADGQVRRQVAGDRPGDTAAGGAAAAGRAQHLVESLDVAQGDVRVGPAEPGERLPAVADLAQHYGVARNTVTRALRRLADDGLVEIVPSWGTFRARS